MTLSIEVLPAPFGPMIARISPLWISSDTSEIALTPPKASETFSTERIDSPAAISLPVGDLTGLSMRSVPPSPGGGGSARRGRGGVGGRRRVAIHPHPPRGACHRAALRADPLARRPPPSRG